ncbi:MAG: Asp23/Gls24 family envelope stress response protein [Christensenellaceae bacterium]|jgi:uncharacterized alkaline shock family protein YloU|nr:Asp23/Gls24 family envelope stress response protein [Christensenellaceae bacterium]
MALSTSNIYGDITISDDVVAIIVSRVALDCYGVVDFVSTRLSDSILAMFNKVSVSKGIKIETEENKVYVELNVIVKDGVNVKTIIGNLKSTIIYNLELITGMRVKAVNVHVVGIRL